MSVQLLDFYPLRGVYLPGEKVSLRLEIRSQQPTAGEVRWIVRHLDHIAQQSSIEVELVEGINQITLEWAPEQDAPRGYGVQAILQRRNGEVLGNINTVFDLLTGWAAYPRYGFLTDFSPGREAPERALESLARYHINGLQFYDWQYRHDHLVAPQEEYLDPLGRQLSLATVRNCIEAAHARGMAAMPYMAVYAASLEFWNEHLDWALYAADGTPLTFEGFLGLMDPSPGSPWTEHLLVQCDRVLTELPFDGLHVDQYGEPKQAFNARHEAVDLPGAFRQFVDRLKSSHPEKTVVFNAVGNWPTDELARSAQDFAYIEVWPPTPYYSDLLGIVGNARNKSSGKAVVVALYLPSEREANIRLADALLLACGATRIEIGEEERLLADPYFPKHQPLSRSVKRFIRKYNDFAVQYGEWLGPAAGALPGQLVEAPAEVWPAVRHVEDWLVVNLVNATDLGGPRWDAPHAPPRKLDNLALTLHLPRAVEQLFWASPDREDPSLQPLEYRNSGLGEQRGIYSIQLNLPSLEYWSLLAIHLQRGN